MNKVCWVLLRGQCPMRVAMRVAGGYDRATDRPITLLPIRPILLMFTRFALVCATLATFSAAPRAEAQTKDQMIADWTRHRTLALAFVDAMPDSAMTHQPASNARSFASAVEHMANESVETAARAIRGLPQVPFTADTAQTLHQKAALRAHVAQSFDYMIDALRGATPAQFARLVVLNGTSRSGARWVAAVQEENVWTLGTLVEYLRLNGVAPPTYVPGSDSF